MAPIAVIQMLQPPPLNLRSMATSGLTQQVVFFAQMVEAAAQVVRVAPRFRQARGDAVPHPMQWCATARIVAHKATCATRRGALEQQRTAKSSIELKEVTAWMAIE